MKMGIETEIHPTTTELYDRIRELEAEGFEVIPSCSCTNGKTRIGIPNGKSFDLDYLVRVTNSRKKRRGVVFGDLRHTELLRARNYVYTLLRFLGYVPD